MESTQLIRVPLRAPASQARDTAGVDGEESPTEPAEHMGAALKLLHVLLTKEQRDELPSCPLLFRDSRAPSEGVLRLQGELSSATLALKTSPTTAELGKKCRDLMAVFGDDHGMLPLRGQAPVCGDDSPAIMELLNRSASKVDHGFDRDGHPCLQ